MHSFEGCLSVVEVVGSLSQVEVEDADAVHLLHLVVLVAQLDVFRDGLCHAVEYAFQVVEFPCELYLHDDYLSLGVLCLDIDAVELVVEGILVAFALENLVDVYLFVEKHGDEPFQHAEVSLVSEHTLGCPVEAYIFVFCHSHLLVCGFCWQSYEKKR